MKQRGTKTRNNMCNACNHCIGKENPKCKKWRMIKNVTNFVSDSNVLSSQPYSWLWRAWNLRQITIYANFICFLRGCESSVHTCQPKLSVKLRKHCWASFFFFWFALDCYFQELHRNESHGNLLLLINDWTENNCKTLYSLCDASKPNDKLSKKIQMKRG